MKFEWHTGDYQTRKISSYNYTYPEGPLEECQPVRASAIACALKDLLGVTMVSSTDNYFTFDIAENINIQTSMWYKCNVIDNNGQSKMINIKVVSTRHIGTIL